METFLCYSTNETLPQDLKTNWIEIVLIESFFAPSYGFLKWHQASSGSCCEYIWDQCKFYTHHFRSCFRPFPSNGFSWVNKSYGGCFIAIKNITKLLVGTPGHLISFFNSILQSTENISRTLTTGHLKDYSQVSLFTIERFSFKKHSINLIKHAFHGSWSLTIKFLQKN